MFDTLEQFADQIGELAKGVYDGDYGTDIPAIWDPSTEAYNELQTAAYNLIGKENPDVWSGGEGMGETGDSVIAAIHEMFDEMYTESYTDVDPTAFAREAELVEAVAFHNIPLQTLDDVVLSLEDSKIIPRLTEMKERVGNITLQPETIKILADRGVDVSSITRVDASADREPVTSEQDQNFTTEVHENIEPVYDENGQVVDIKMVNPDGTEIGLQQILEGLGKEDTFAAIAKEALRNDNPTEYLHGEISKLVEASEARQDVSREESTSGASPNPSSTVTNHDDKNETSIDHQASFETHQSAYKERRAEFVFGRDTVAAFHDLARTYHAAAGGIEINGKVPNAMNVYMALDRFLNSNPLETLVLSALYKAFGEKDEKNDVSVENRDNTEIVSDATDKLGIKDNGTIDKVSDIPPTMPDQVERYRNQEHIPMAAMQFGADMTKVDRGSDESMTIRTTNPDRVDGAGISTRLENATKYTFPDARLVDFRGDRAIVDPFGKILYSEGDRFAVGKTIAELDVSAGKRGAEALTAYANDHGLTAEQAKEKISAEIQSRFSGRIERTYLIEARSINDAVIPNVKASKASLVSQDAILGRMEAMANAKGDKSQATAISEMRSKIQGAIEAHDNKILNLIERREDLMAQNDKIAGGGSLDTSSRFEAACSSESKAIGRSVFGVENQITQDNKAKIDDMVSLGRTEIGKRLDAYNADKPELERLSFDYKTGDFVDRYGINQKGEYVGAVVDENGRLVAPNIGDVPKSQDEISAYVDKYYDAGRFPIEKILGAGESGSNTDVSTEAFIEKKVDSDNSHGSDSSATTPDDAADPAIGESDSDSPVDNNPDEKGEFGMDEKATTKLAEDGEVVAVDGTAAAEGGVQAGDKEDPEPKEGATELREDDEKEATYDDIGDAIDACLDSVAAAIEEGSVIGMSEAFEAVADKIQESLCDLKDSTPETLSEALKSIASDFVESAAAHLDEASELRGELTGPTSELLEKIFDSVGPENATELHEYITNSIDNRTTNSETKECLYTALDGAHLGERDVELPITPPDCAVNDNEILLGEEYAFEVEDVTAGDIDTGLDAAGDDVDASMEIPDDMNNADIDVDELDELDAATFVE